MKLPFQNYKGVMVDLETLSTQPNAVIVSIGAVKFSFDIGIQSKFKVNISGKSCHDHGLHLDPNTIEWWQKQSKEAQDSWKVNPLPLKDGLEMFLEWWGDEKDIWFYCNGLSFDAPVLRTALYVVGKEQPWKYYHEMDLRTIYNMIGYDRKKRAKDASLVYHDALADAEFQTKELLELFPCEAF
jgi:DNA polymerase III epsilon subunit-like protein